MEVAKQFGRNLSTARREAGMSQEEVGSCVFTDRVGLSHLETGKRCPRLDLVVDLAEAVGVQVRDLLYGIE